MNSLWLHRLLLLLLSSCTSASLVPYQQYILPELQTTIIPFLQGRFENSHYTEEQRKHYTKSYLRQFNIFVPEEGQNDDHVLRPSSIPDIEYGGPIERSRGKEVEIDELPIDRFLRESVGSEEFEAMWNNRLESVNLNILQLVIEDSSELLDEDSERESDEDPFERDDLHFRQFLVGKLFSETIQVRLQSPASFKSVPRHRLIQCLTRSMLMNDIALFSHLMQSSKIYLYDCPHLNDLLYTLVKPQTDSKFLTVFLEGCQDDTIILDIASLLNTCNLHLHQTVMDLCASRLPIEAVMKLSATCKIPAILQKVWESNKPEILNIELLNHLGEESHEQIARFENDNVQIMCMYSKEGPPITMSDYLDVPRLTKRYQRLAKKAETERRFCLIHIDKINRHVTIMKSANKRGPVFLAYHLSMGQERVIDEGIMSQFFAPSPITTTTTESHLLTVQFYLTPGMIIVGLPQSIMMSEDTEPSQFLPSALNSQTPIQSIWDVKCLLKQNFASARSVMKLLALVIGIVPQQ